MKDQRLMEIIDEALSSAGLLSLLMLMRAPNEIVKIEYEKWNAAALLAEQMLSELPEEEHSEYLAPGKTIESLIEARMHVEQSFAELMGEDPLPDPESVDIDAELRKLLGGEAA